MYNPANWYWAGEPDGRTSPIVYSSAEAKVIAADDAAYKAWSETPAANVATPWPKDETGAVTAAALDEVLTAAGLPVTGLRPITPPTIEQLAAAVASGAAAAAASITNQIAPDATHQNAYLNAAAMVWGAGGAAPASGPAEAVFAAYAAQFAVAPAVLAARVVAGSIAAMELSGALGTLQGAVAEAADAAQLTTALAAFETAISGIVANLTAAGLSVTAPATISVPGVNA
jgi:hypothetical protein